MNYYSIAIIRNGQNIAEYDIDADGVVEILRSLHAAEHKISEGDDAPEVQPARQPAKVASALKPAPARNKQGGCDECGSKGRRHKNGCVHAAAKQPRQKMSGNAEWQALGEVSSPTRRMSRMVFGRVKISQSHDIPADTIARNIDEEESEVEKAFEAETYDDYLKL